MSIVRVAPMPARACRESLPAGEPHLTRRPSATGDPPALADDILGGEHDPPA